jgi:ankyrin repeat protein
MSTTPNSTPPEPRRLSIHLPRPLWIGLATVALIGASLGVRYGVPIYRQQVAIREIERAGGSVIMNTAGPFRLRRWLNNWISDSWLRPFDSIARADVIFRETIDDDIKHFLAVRPLPELYIEGGPSVHEFLSNGQLDEARAAFLKHPILLFSRDAGYIYSTPLQIAVRAGQIELRQRVEMVKFLLERGADVDAVGIWTDNISDIPTPLLRAKDPEIVKLLIDYGADLAAGGPNSKALETKAHEFAKSKAEDREKWLEITRLLRAAGAEYGIVAACYLNDLARVRQITERRGRVPRDVDALCVAATYGHAEIVKVLLEHGADADRAGPDGHGALFCAIKHPDVLELLFGAIPDGSNPRDEHRNLTLLHSAADHGAVESARLILARGIPVDSRDAYGHTSLHSAAKFGQLDVVQLLLDHNADPTAVDEWGYTAISYAMGEIDWLGYRKTEPELANSRRIAELLLAAGTPVDLFAAISLGQTAVVSQILTETPELANNKDYQGATALVRAVNWDRVEIVEALLAAGADVNALNDSRASALHQAACLGRDEIARVLIAHKADVNAGELYWATPLHEAARHLNQGVARLLLDAGANPDAKDELGDTPRDLARRSADRAATESARIKLAETIELLSERERN